MPNVKIELIKGETAEEAEELLLKAFESQRNGSIHKEEFHDPAMRDLAIRIMSLHQVEYDKMLQEIFEELDKEYQDNGDL